MSKNLTNIIISVIAIVLLVALIKNKYSYDANKEAAKTKLVDSLKKTGAMNKALYEDSLNFVRGQAELQANANAAHTLRIRELEANIDDLVKRHSITKSKLKKIEGFNSDTGYVLAPNEYINECEGCFDALITYKKENQQLRFERDSYDTIMRAQASIQENRIAQLEKEKLAFAKAFSERTLLNAEPTRKLKASAMGMLNDLFIPNAGGAGLIYEDKKFNEYGAHVLLSSRGNIYLFHVAKTISFKRKK